MVLLAPKDGDLLKLIDKRLGAHRGLTEHRKSLDLTESDLARLAQVSAKTISRVERARAWRVTRATLTKILGAINEVRLKAEPVKAQLRRSVPEQ